jgi:hypothetical protein
MHAVGLMGQQRKNALPWQWTRTQQWEGRVSSAICPEEVFSLRSVPRLYNQGKSCKDSYPPHGLLP